VFQGGLYLDAWAHLHRPELEKLLTPWHAVFYSGFFAVATATVAPLLLRRRAPGTAWSAALPAGYDLSLIGVFVFFLGGVLDMLWHYARRHRGGRSKHCCRPPISCSGSAARCC